MAILSTHQKWEVGTASTVGVISFVAGSLLAAKISAAVGTVFIVLGGALLLASFGYLVQQSKLAKNACTRVEKEISHYWQNLDGLNGNIPYAGDHITKELLEQTVCKPTNPFARIFIPVINQIFEQEGLVFRFPRPANNPIPFSPQESAIIRDLNLAPWQRNKASRPQPNVPDQVKDAVQDRLFRLIQSVDDPDFTVLSCFQEENLESFLGEIDVILNNPLWEDNHDQILGFQRTINAVLEQNHLLPRYLLVNLRPEDLLDSDDDEAEGPALVASMKEENPLRYGLEELDDSDE